VREAQQRAKAMVSDAGYILDAVLAEMGQRLSFDWRQPIRIEDDGTLTAQDAPK
jgi:hypothetical protein